MIIRIQSELQLAQQNVSTLQSARDCLSSQLTAEKDNVIVKHQEEVSRLQAELACHQQAADEQKSLLTQSQLVIVISFYVTNYITARVSYTVAGWLYHWHCVV